MRLRLNSGLQPWGFNTLMELFQPDSDAPEPSGVPCLTPSNMNIFQALFQFAPGPEKPGFHRPDAQAEPLGDLFVGQVLPFPQDHDLPEALRQFGHRGAHLRGPFLPHQRLGGIPSPGRDPFAQGHPLQGVLVQTGGETHLLPAEMVDGLVARKTEEPVVEWGLETVGAHLVVQFDEYVLDHVLGRVGERSMASR